MTIEMILSVNGDNIMCFANVRTHRNYDAVVVAHQAVRKRVLEINGSVEIISVICAGKDITEQVLELDKDFHSRELFRLDKEIPF